MRIYIEFVGWASEKAKRSWLWLEISEGSSLRELFVDYLAGVLGKEVANAFLDAFKNGLLRVLVNGRAVHDLDYTLSGDDKVYLLPMAAGGRV